jgi:hypothetical protein
LGNQVAPLQIKGILVNRSAFPLTKEIPMAADEIIISLGLLGYRVTQQRRDTKRYHNPKAPPPQARRDR